MATAPDTVTETTAPVAEVDKPYDASDFYADDQPQPKEPVPSEVPEADDAPQGDTDEAGEDGETTEEQSDEPELEPIAAPNSWAKEAKEAFDKLPRELQEVVSKRESERDKLLNQKSIEAARTRENVEAEARQVLQTIHRNHSEQLQRYASQFEAEAPDARLLETGDPEHLRLYMQQQARYTNTAAQREQAQREAEYARQQADEIAAHEHQLEVQQFHQTLAEAIPEWSEPSSRAKLLSDLQPIAAELGYSEEVISQANASDILALRKVHALKVDADKYRALMKQKMVPVRAAKSLPPTARSGSVNAGQPRTVDPMALLYPDDQPRH